jgi:hypothetical protein
MEAKLRQTRHWKRVPVRELDPACFGKVNQIYRRGDHEQLLLYRPRSRHSLWRRRIATWVVVSGNLILRRLHLYGRRYQSIPRRWANHILHRYTRGKLNPLATLDPDIPLDCLVRTLPGLPEELPVNLAGPVPGVVSVPDKAPSEVVCRLPDVPPRQTLSGRYLNSILTQLELGLYLETWDRWASAHPHFLTGAHRDDLITVCRETVIAFRIFLLMKSSPFTLRLYRLMAASHRRSMIARCRLGAVRRLRVARS